MSARSCRKPPAVPSFARSKSIRQTLAPPCAAFNCGLDPQALTAQNNQGSCNTTQWMPIFKCIRSVGHVMML